MNLKLYFLFVCPFIGPSLNWSSSGYLSGKAPTDEMIAEAKKLGCGRLSVPIEGTTRQFARKIKAAGLQLSLWPIRAKEDADLAVLWGAAIICTDTPGDLLKLAAP